jgi:hypothetical protein
LASAPLTAASVAASRTLYLSTADQAAQAARRVRDWDEVARIRREEAGALFAEAGGTVPPAEDVVALYRDGVSATLRASSKVSRHAELIGSSCCARCRIDNGRTFRIADELRATRLPHEGCPRGLCGCDWWPVLSTVAKAPRRRRAAAATPAGGGASPVDEDAAREDGAEPDEDAAGGENPAPGENG